MKNTFLLLLCAATCSCFAQKDISDIHFSRDSIAHLTKEAIVSDLSEYKHRIAVNHVNPFTHIRKKDFYGKVDSLIANADNYNIDELLIELLKINALLQDEHTKLIFVFRDRFPFFCYCYTDGVYITATDDNNLRYLFSKVIAVNGVPVDKVLQQLSLIVPNKNRANILKYASRDLFNPFILHGLKIAPSRTKAAYTIVTPANDTVTIEPTPKDERDMNIRNGFDKKQYLRTSQRGNYWYKYVDTGNYMYFKYNSCHNNVKRPLDKMEDSMMTEIELKKPRKIIIDLRDNGGGYPHLLDDFVEHLLRSSLNTQGGIYVLIGRNTFSAAIINAETLKKHTHAILVGEETSGSTDFFGGVKYFDLPATNLKVMYSTNRYLSDERYEGSLQPDITINETFDNYTKGIDGPLQYAVTH